MKAPRTISKLFFCFILAAVTADAQPWKGWQGSGGWGPRSHYQRMYDPQTVVTVLGIVESIETIRPAGRMSYGVHLKMRTEKGALSVHLGPAWFLERQDVEIAPGDTIEVKGSNITFNGEPTMIAAEVKTGDVVLRLRDKNGYPVWAGARRRR